jgi:glycerol-3-phosphate acyltransferase PlsX
MGGDYAPQEPVKGVVEALREKPELYVYLVGQEDVLKKELDKYTYPKERLEVVHASEIIETGEPPVHAIQKKKDSSLVKALRMVRSKEASAFVSCGSTGAVLVGGQVLVGKSKGVERMGSIYMEYVMGVKNPKVGLVNIGAEEEKGNALVKETYPLLKECKDINFIGNVEARDIPKGVCDVVVCEAFVGNVILKLYEGVGATLISKVKAGMMSTLRSKIGALLVKPALKETLKSFDASEYGGAPLLGLKGLVVKAHGSSKANEIKNSLIQCITFSKEDICGKIQENMKQDNKGDN